MPFGFDALQGFVEAMRMRFADGTERTADFGDSPGRGVFRQWEDPGVWEGMRMSEVAVE